MWPLKESLLAFISGARELGTWTWLRRKEQYLQNRYNNFIKIMQRSHRLLWLSSHCLVVLSSALSSAVQSQLPIRCSSRDAAGLIQNRTASSVESLLVITCDASGRGGGSKHDGIAAVLRIRNGVALERRLLEQTPPNNDVSSPPTATIIGDSSSQQFLTMSSSVDEREDLIHAVARRTVPSRTSSEVAAIALGIKHAIKNVPISLRSKVLILSDSEFALDFYCGERSYEKRRQNTRRRKNNSSNKRRGKRQPTTRSTELREESYWRSFATLIREATPGGVILSKIKSSSRSVGLSYARDSETMQDQQSLALDSADNTDWDGKGFLDHDASDYLSSNARYNPNSSDDDAPSFRPVSKLKPSDLKWLYYSDYNDKLGFDNTIVSNDNIMWNEIIVKGNDARNDRRKRKERRIESIRKLIDD